MTVAVGYQRASRAVLGAEFPRIAPPLPLRSRVDQFNDAATVAGIEPYPWQLVASKYLTALGPDDRPLYREVAVVVGRQNGKTTLLLPYIVDALRRGKKIVHTAQNMKLPRDIFLALSDIVELGDEFTGRVSRAHGAESIFINNGGRYQIVAATRSAARGLSVDIVIIDELREFVDWDFIGAVRPTLTARSGAQMVYLSNAGEERSVVLNGIRARADTDPKLAYLEWSADQHLATDDVRGWAQANPAMGHNPAIFETLEADYLTDKLAGTLAIFETEHLCRWVDTLRPSYVAANAWMRLHGQLEKPVRPYMGISVDPAGRASAVIAWRQTTGSVAVRLIADTSPFDPDGLGPELKKLSLGLGVVGTAFDPWTDTDLARRLPKAKPLAGRDYAVACENFARRVADGSIRWDGSDQVGIDLGWTTRKNHESGAYHAVRSSDEHSITAALAAIRAVWLATSEKPPAPKVL